MVVKNIVDGETDKTGGESLRGDCMPVEEEEDAAEDQATEEAPKMNPSNPESTFASGGLGTQLYTYPFSQLVLALCKREEQGRSPQGRCRLQDLKLM